MTDITTTDDQHITSEPTTGDRPRTGVTAQGQRDTSARIDGSTTDDQHITGEPNPDDQHITDITPKDQHITDITTKDQHITSEPVG